MAHGVVVGAAETDGDTESEDVGEGGVPVREGDVLPVVVILADGLGVKEDDQPPETVGEGDGATLGEQLGDGVELGHMGEGSALPPPETQLPIGLTHVTTDEITLPSLHENGPTIARPLLLVVSRGLPGS